MEKTIDIGEYQLIVRHNNGLISLTIKTATETTTINLESLENLLELINVLKEMESEAREYFDPMA